MHKPIIIDKAFRIYLKVLSYLTEEQKKEVINLVTEDYEGDTTKSLPDYFMKIYNKLLDEEEKNA